MAKAGKAKLKLFKTVIGFHDAYVAAASQKAALEAWGASTDLFSAGLAERVEDAAACEAAFADPGAVITAKRGTKGEWRKRPRPKAGAPGKAAKREAERKKVEARIAKADSQFEAAAARIEGKIAGLRKEREALQARHRSERAKLEAEREALGD